MTKAINTSTIKKKIKGFGPVYWINLDSDVERKEKAEELFKYYDISNVRISGFDGRKNDLSVYLEGGIPHSMNAGEVGCTLSHLKALRYFLEETDEDIAIICEDDIVFDTVEFWPFNWKLFMESLPYDWDCLQLSVTATGNLVGNLHPRILTNFCTVCNVFTRRYAQKLSDLHFRGDKYKIDNGVKPRAVADEILFNAGKTYSMPLFVYRHDFHSNIHQDHVEAFHKKNVEAISKFWKENGYQIPISNLLDYDYYTHYMNPPAQWKDGPKTESNL